jgi:hypothetical protein
MRARHPTGIIPFHLQEEFMPQMPLDGMRVAILVSDDFEQIEMTEPKKALVEAGAEVRIVSPNKGRITGVQHDEKRMIAKSIFSSTRRSRTISMQ